MLQTRFIAVTFGIAVAMPAYAQSRVQIVNDSLVDFEVKPATQLRRHDNGDFVIGPLTGSKIVARITANSRTVRSLATNGAGPTEQSGWLVIATASGQRTIVVANQLNRTTVYGRSGNVEKTAGAILVPEGVALCGREIFMTGVHNGGTQGVAEGLFVADSGRRVRLVHSTKRSSAVRPTLGSTDMLAVRGDRLLAAVPNRAELVVSDSGCGTFRSLPVSIPWFVPWDKYDGGYPFVKPIQSRVVGVRWLAENRAAMLIVRAHKNAKFEPPPQASARPLPRGSGPWAETVLILVNMPLGRVISEQVLSQHEWRFASDSEVVAHTLRGEDRTGFVLQNIEPATRR